MPLLLKELHVIRKNWYSPTPDSPLVAEVKFIGDHGEVKINLKEDVTQKILGVLAEGLVDAAQEVAKNLTVDIISQSAPALPSVERAPSDPF